MVPSKAAKDFRDFAWALKRAKTEIPEADRKVARRNWSNIQNQLHDAAKDLQPKHRKAYRFLSACAYFTYSIRAGRKAGYNRFIHFFLMIIVMERLFSRKAEKRKGDLLAARIKSISRQLNEPVDEDELRKDYAEVRNDLVHGPTKMYSANEMKPLSEKWLNLSGKILRGVLVRDLVDALEE